MLDFFPSWALVAIGVGIVVIVIALVIFDRARKRGPNNTD